MRPPLNDTPINGRSSVANLSFMGGIFISQGGTKFATPRCIYKYLLLLKLHFWDHDITGTIPFGEDGSEKKVCLNLTEKPF